VLYTVVHFHPAASRTTEMLHNEDAATLITI
jgi:hypothetical protein